MKRGTRVGQAYVAVTADGDGINEEIVDSVDKAGPGVDKAGKKHGKRYSERFAQTLDALPEKIKNRLGETLGLEGERAGTEAGERAGRGFGKAFSRNLARSIGEELEIVIARQLDLFEAAKRDIDSGGVSGNRGRNRGRGSTIGATIGGFLGAGSRNDFLNILGKSFGKAIDLVETMREKAFEMFKTFSTGFKGLEEGASTLQRFSAGFKALGGGGGGLFASLSAALPVIAAVIVALSVMASIIGGVIGVVTALSSAIVSGLVGSLLVAGPLIAATVAGIGLMVIALTSLTDAQRKMFLPLKAEFTGLGQEILAGMSESTKGFKTWVDNIGQSIALILPYVHEFGAALGEAGNILTKSFSGPGFALFAASLGQYLPGIITNLSTALGNFLNGLLGMFAAVMPQVLQFSKYLADVTDRFSRWATSAKGQNAIEDFTNRALTSLKSLWGFVREFFGFLGDILFSPQAQNAGNTIFDGMARTFAHFRDVVREAAADGSLQEWFDSAVRFGRALWAVIESLGGTFMALYNSGVLDGISGGMENLASVIDFLNTILTPFIDALGGATGALSVMLGPIGPLIQGLGQLGNAIDDVKNRLGDNGSFLDNVLPGRSFWKTKNGDPTARGNLTGDRLRLPFGAGMAASLAALRKKGLAALNATSKKYGGLRDNKPAYVNPYEDFANSLIKDTDSISARIKKAVRDMTAKITDALRDGAKSTDVTALRESLLSTAESIRATAQNSVDTAQQALNSAASTLASASSAKAAKAAMKKVKDAQRDLEAALKSQKRIDSIAKYLSSRQRVSSESRVQQLLRGLGSQNATLADYAVARGRLAVRLEAANQKLADAISLRDEFRNAVTQSAAAFGALTTTQAQTLNGIEQALTATDITTNLQARLDKIRKFQADLRLLTAQGLNAAAYKQIVDAGVEEGSKFTSALLAGGLTAVQQTNSLVSQIEAASNSLGLEASSRMYQAGVDAARGLVAGLTSLSAQLDSAAVRLGNTIAGALRRALGIHSPSTVLDRMMDYVGDGAVKGLDRQHNKVDTAAGRLASRIAVSPEAARAASSYQSEEVSGNREKGFRDLIVQTPTEDPVAVAHEVVNEVVGRIP